MSDFQDDFAILISREMPRARRDPERMANLIGDLVDSLALAVALATIGNGHDPSELLDGISAQLIEGVAEKAPIALVISGRTA